MLLRNLMFYAASFLILIFYGCSTDFDAENQTSSSGTTTTTTVYQSIGASTCISCHSSIAATAGMAVSDYLAGEHVIHSTSITASSASSCLSCHDPLGDGITLEPAVLAIDPSKVPATGLAAVTCEACHGGGGEHFAVTSTQVPDPTPDYKVCATCHKTLDSEHLKYHPEADDIAGKFEGSPHFNRLTSMDTAPCNACHSDEGARANKDVTFNAPPVWLDANISTLTTAASPIQCRTCHNAHSLQLLMGQDENVTGSAEYNTCTNCHQTADSYHGENRTKAEYGLFFSRINYDTHNIDNPLTPDAIEGYNFDPTSVRVCRDCHDVHTADTTYNKQWAKSGHGGHIAEIKEAAEPSGLIAVQDAAVPNTSPWAHYDWDDTGGWGGRPRGDCQRCHTATGAKNYLNSLISGATYDPANNDYSHLTGWINGGPSSGQNEMLYCWGCHTDNSGALRNPGAVTTEYVTPVTLSDLGKSNVCVPCHVGQGNVSSYTLTGDPATDLSAVVPARATNPNATHYFPAAAIIYQDKGQTNIGYEYPGQDYSDPFFYGHYKVGLNNTFPESGTGPCATCHMESKNHSLSVVEKVAGVITGIKPKICVSCHDGEHALFVSQDLVGTTQDIWDGVSAAVPTVVTQAMADAAAAEIEDEAEGFHEAITIVEQELIAAGITIDWNTYPYFGGASWINEGVFGAAQNLNVLLHEPGAYAHNRYYAKRLIYDSLDWLDDYTLNGSVTINPGTYPDAYAWMLYRGSLVRYP